MPAYNKATSSNLKRTDPYPQPADESDSQSIVADQDSSSRAGKRKIKNAVKSPSVNHLDHADKPSTADQMGPSNTSILGQLQQGFSQSRKTPGQDALNDMNSTQKVSDESTPPLDVWGRSAAVSRSPPADTIPGLNISGSPRVEPGFSGRGPFASRSPPISPPLRKARPVSYGSSIPPMPSHPRMSTSPYGYAQGAYGSPPVPPHLPQQHFYGPHDVDLNLPASEARTRFQHPTPLKLSYLAGPGQECTNLVFLAVDNGLSILSSNGERLEQIGALHGMPGTVLDACILTWSAGNDPLAEYRPLVAVTLHGTTSLTHDSPTAHEQPHPRARDEVYETRVVVYSLTKRCLVTELLRAPSPATIYFGNQPSAANLKLGASGNFFTITSGASGEIFVFGIRNSKDGAVFECLAKYWSSLQPHMQRRESSHGRTPDPDVSPADLGRGPESEDATIMSLNGRWLAFAPASTPSPPSIGAVLGDFVAQNKNSLVAAAVAPPRPQVNCEVDSPDAETFFSKVAKGFAQEAVKSAKWIGEKGMQTWQNYWKKETSPSISASNASTPPVFSPQLGVTQFPPTHASDSPGLTRDLEVVTIIDLRSLQENLGRRTPESCSVATFRPPGGCSFLSFAPNGLSLMTANRKGDVQYIWDLLQIKYVRSPYSPANEETGRVRQIARYERLSPSTIVDVVWDGPNGHRFALLTRNRTIHVFDLPKAAFQWPPPRAKKHRPMSVPVDSSPLRPDAELSPQGGFLASARNFAGRTQPMLATLRGRAPSVTSGISGIGASGIGLASTTGIKGGRAVAAGLSKSLGAASETVTSIRHANQSRLHLKTVARPGMLIWQQRDGRSVLSVIDATTIKIYYVRMTKPRENRERETVSVFDARKPVGIKLPKVGELLSELERRGETNGQGESPTDEQGDSILAMWKTRTTKESSLRMPHPLASAEIETNAPFQPFHSDYRVSVSILPDAQTLQSGDSSASQNNSPWVFGAELFTSRMATSNPAPIGDDNGSVIYRKTTLAVTGNLPVTEFLDIADEGVTHIVSSTKKKKKKSKTQPTLLDEDDKGDSDLTFSKHDRGLEFDIEQTREDGR
ncbi:hypothetical protein PV10_07755 [Exophiala mesophila]|uniref:BCAS3 domain-containing protein n=1 Tax=Exophiala mesophila TaxID=212818 RepID=A0A0D1ZUI6_EXOME|nr:uncharacterized protein PV10_07755 [Exophiala mesophila]KIV90448.1 hypothetical protein PV10_07755 [Exophiala mesophila]